MNWFCSRSHIAGLVWCQVHTPVPRVRSGLGEQPFTVDGRAMPLALVLCGEINRTMYICFIFAVLYPLSGWGSGGGEFTMCGSHQLFTYYEQIFSLLHLNFCSVHGVNSSLPACTCEAKRVTGWQWSNACPQGRFFLKSLYGLLSPHITGRKKIGGFQRLTSVLWWWLTAMGTRRKGGLGEEWDWRRLLFEGRESDSPESAGVWLCYSHCFLAWFESPFACTELPWS